MIKKILYYIHRIQQVWKQHWLLMVIQASISRLIWKDYEFVKFALRKWKYLFRGSDTGFLMIKDIYEYRQKEWFLEKYNMLINGLDWTSKKAIDEFLRINTLYYHNNLVHESEIFSEDSYKAQKKALEFMSKFGVLHPTWYYVCDDIKLLERIKSGNIIDCGACDGTESLMFAKFTNWSSTVYAFEPSSENFKLLQRNINSSDVGKWVSPQQLGLWDKEEDIEIYGNSWWEVSKIDLHHSQESSEIMKFTTIDIFKSNNHIKTVSLIKRDIEWGERDSIMGAEKTIKSDKPILIISIYHNGKQFFEIKPLLESWNLWYKFKIVQSEPENSRAGYVLIAY